MIRIGIIKYNKFNQYYKLMHNKNFNFFVNPAMNLNSLNHLFQDST